MQNIWVRTNEAEDVLGSIHHAIRTAQFAGEDPLSYKWVLLALHSALQGACVCHLMTSAAPIGAVTDRNARDWLVYLESLREDREAKPPRTYLMNFPDLLQAVRKPQSAGDRTNQVGVSISEAEFSWLRCIHEDIRNQFVHFQPMGWSIEVSGVPDLVKLIARIIEEILEIGWAFRHLRLVKREELRQSLNSLSRVSFPSQLR